MLNVAMLSKWHVHAKDYARQAQALPRVKLTAVWDEDEARGREWAQGLGVPFEASLDAVLARSDVDAVIVDAPTNLHPEVMIAAARAGKHIFTEKVLALTLAEGRAIAEAVERAGVRFCISLPHRTEPQALLAKRLIEEGLLGDITLVRCRKAHDGATRDWLPPHFYSEEQCGGGAMLDLGAHPMYLARWLLGAPVSVLSSFTSVAGKGVEDNAVCLVEFARGAQAVVETGFVSSGSPFTLEVHGTEGCLLWGGAEGKLSVSSRRNPGLVGWVTPTLPAGLPPALEQWVGSILDGTEPAFGMDDALQLTELMEAAYRSHREGRRVSLGKTQG